VKKPIWKGWKNSNLSHSIKGKTLVTVIRDCQGLVKRESWIGRAQRTCRAVKILCNTMLVDICLYIFCPNPYEVLMPRVNLVVMMCQCRFINCNHSGRGILMWRRLCIYGYRLWTAQKNKSLKKLWSWEFYQNRKNDQKTLHFEQIL
jgi:hypothetical protein